MFRARVLIATLIPSLTPAAHHSLPSFFGSGLQVGNMDGNSNLVSHDETCLLLSLNPAPHVDVFSSSSVLLSSALGPIKPVTRGNQRPCNSTRELRFQGRPP